MREVVYTVVGYRSHGVAVLRPSVIDRKPDPAALFAARLLWLRLAETERFISARPVIASRVLERV